MLCFLKKINSFRADIKVLDCTLRDVGVVKNLNLMISS